MSRSACAQFLFDQFERARRGVNRWRNDSSSSACRTPSIHPQAIATTTQSSQVTLGRPEPFLNIRTHSSLDVAWFFFSHAASCSRDANARPSRWVMATAVSRR